MSEDENDELTRYPTTWPGAFALTVNLICKLIFWTVVVLALVQCSGHGVKL